MKKEAIYLFFVFLFSITFVIAEDNITEADYSSKIQEGFSCLEEKVGDNCSNVEEISELSLIILSGPENVFGGCTEKLKQKITNYQSIESKDLAQAILALNYAGENVTELVNEIKNRSRTDAPVEWIISGINSGESENIECTIKHGENQRFEFDVSEKGKITITKVDYCFLDDGGFGIKILNKCYGEELTMSCTGEYSIPLTYKKRNGDLIYVLRDTTDGSANQELKFSVNSLCIGNLQGRCDYEATLWGAYSMRVAEGCSIDDYMPYIITSIEDNTVYFPEAFVGLIDLNFLFSYSKDILDKQKRDGSWNLGRYGYEYDTALAILSYGIKEGETDISERWLYTKQGDDGCWSTVESTAMILWALAGKEAPTNIEGNESSTYPCESGDYYCLPSTLCNEESLANEHYTCRGQMVCCTELKTCDAWGGIVCEEGKECNGPAYKASDVDECCIPPSICENPETSSQTCEEMGYICYSNSNLPEDDKNYFYSHITTLDYTCDGSESCYSKEEKDKDTTWIIWVLIVLIIGVIGLIFWKFKDKIREIFDKIKKGGKKGDEGNQQPGGGIPPGGNRPPFPPARPGMPPQMTRPGGVIRPAPFRGMPPRFNVPQTNQQGQRQNGI